MTSPCSIQSAFEMFKGIAPTGFVVGFHASYASPAYLWQNYPEDWIRIYSEEGLHLQDPSLAWALQNRGGIRWSEMDGDGSSYVMTEAAKYGLAHGAIFSLERRGALTIAGFARPDREFHDTEMQALHAELAALIDLVSDEAGVLQDAKDRMDELRVHPSVP